MSSLLVRTLGPLEALVDGVPVRLGGAKQRAVLSCLALRANRVAAAELLVEAVWQGHPPPKPSGVLQVYIANLRRVLASERGKGGPRLVREGAGYRLRVDDVELDLLLFRRLLYDGATAAEGGDLPTAAEALRTAVQLFRGPGFPHLVDVEQLQPELVEIEECRIGAYEDLLEIELRLGRHVSVLSELQSLVAQHPFRERLWASLVIALYRSERQAEALAACRDARRVLVDELGIDPGPALRQVEVAVLQQDPALNAPVQPADRRRRRLERLPAPVNTIVGRDDLLVELDRLLGGAEARLVTLTGPGGAGKTRFALAAAWRCGLAQRDGAVWVDLAPLTDAAQVPSAIARAVGVADRAEDDLVHALKTFVQSRRLMLVLDNFEHVEPAWPIIPELLTAAPHLLILVTSRRALRLRAEHTFELPPLTMPRLDPPPPLTVLRTVPAVELFVERATAAKREFELTSGNAQTVARLCRRLDGLPLALELAAAQLQRWTEDQLLLRLKSELTAIPAALRDLPARQQTLNATIAWSRNLLATAERDLFDELGVFSGDPTTAAVAAICMPSEPEHRVEVMLSALSLHSLAKRYTDPSGAIRLTMLQSIREFARDRLSTWDTVGDLRRRHAEYYAAKAENLGPQLWGPEQFSAIRTLHAETDDLRAALHWAGGPDGSAHVALRLIGQLWHYWELSGDISGPNSIAQPVIAKAGHADPRVFADALSGAATLAWLSGNRPLARNLHERALTAFRRVGDQGGIAWSLMCMAVQELEGGRPGAAQDLIAESLAVPGATLCTRASADLVLGVLALWAGEVSKARTHYEASLNLARRVGDRWTQGKALVNLADAAEVSGDYDRAANLLREALQNSRQIDDRVVATFCLEALATLLLRRGRPEQAARIFAAAHAYRAETVLPLNTHEQERTNAVLDQIRATAGPVPFAVAWAGGEELSLDQAITETLQAFAG